MALKERWGGWDRPAGGGDMGSKCERGEYGGIWGNMCERGCKRDGPGGRGRNETWSIGSRHRAHGGSDCAPPSTSPKPLTIPGGPQRVRLRTLAPVGSEVGVACSQSAVQGALRPLAAPSLPGSTATASTTAAC